MSALHGPRIQDGSLLELALGARSLCRRFDEILERYGAAADVAAAQDSEWLFVVLGIVAMRQRLERVFPTTEPVATPHIDAELQDLLR